MQIAIVIPADLWEDDSEAVITAWLFNNGDEVDTGDLLAEVMVEKAQYEIVAPSAGILTIIKHEDEVVIKGAIIATLDA